MHGRAGPTHAAACSNRLCARARTQTAGPRCGRACRPTAPSAQHPCAVRKHKAPPPPASSARKERTRAYVGTRAGLARTRPRTCKQRCKRAQWRPRHSPGGSHALTRACTRLHRAHRCFAVGEHDGGAHLGHQPGQHVLRAACRGMGHARARWCCRAALHGAHRPRQRHACDGPLHVAQRQHRRRTASGVQLQLSCNQGRVVQGPPLACRAAATATRASQA